VGVLVEEVVFGDPHILEAGRIGRYGELEIVDESVMLGVGITSPILRYVPLDEDAEFHCIRPFSRTEASPPYFVNR
jgi:hypothetical protein